MNPVLVFAFETLRMSVRKDSSISACLGNLSSLK